MLAPEFGAADIGYEWPEIVMGENNAATHTVNGCNYLDNAGDG